MMTKFICMSLLLALGGIGHAQAPKPPAAPPAPAPVPGAPPAPAAPAAPAIDASSPDLATATTKAYEEGFALMQDGKFKEALDKVAFIVSKMNKPPAPVRFMEGACWFNLGDFAKAATAFETYLKDYPVDAKTGGADLIKESNSVKMGLGRAYLKSGKEEDGVKLLLEVAGVPELKGEAGLLLAEHYKKAGNTEEALKILNSIVSDGVRSPEQIQAALMAADMYVAAGDTDKAGQMLESAKGSGGTSGENVIQLNNIGLKLGDKMLEEKSFRQALAAYQSVRRKSEVVRLQKERIAKIQLAISKAKGGKEDLEAKLAADKGMLDELEKRTDYDASLFYRLGRCYFEMQRPWEAILAFEAIVTEFKDFPQRDKAMYGMIMANASLKRIKVAQEQCEKFIRDFPDSSEVGPISELFGMLSYQIGDLEGAEKNFNKAKTFPKADKEKMGYLRGNVLFEMQRFQDAITEFEILKKDFPTSGYMDDAEYRIALAYFYQNDFPNTLKALQAYIKGHAKGQYVIDAKYRLAFIKFQGGKVDEAMKELIGLVEESPNDPNIAQVYILLADGFSRKAMTSKDPEADYEKALEGYMNGVKKAKTEDVLKYAMEQATELLQSSNKWAELADMWNTYLKTHDKDPAVRLKAIYWVVRALIHDQKVEEAKKMLSDNIRPYISNPTNDQVEGLIQQLCGLMVPKKRRLAPVATEAAGTAASPAAGEAAAAAAAPEPVVSPADAKAAAAAASAAAFEDLQKQLEEMLKPDPMTPVANVRIMFARAYLAQKMRLMEQAEKIYTIIIEVAKAEDLSPLLLTVVGDNARKKGIYDKAQACYERLQTIFPESEYADGAPVGLGEIHFIKGEYDAALKAFEEATSEKYQGSGHLLDATLGKAKTLLKLGKLDLAEKEYDRIARLKEWRMSWAEALYGLGQVKEARKDYAGAIAFYQRVFIAHQKYKDWMARAYLQSARCFLLLNKKDEAKKTLQEMVKRNDIKDQPEFKDAQNELQKLGA